MKVLLAVDRALSRVEGWILIALLSVMVLLSFVQVVLRNVFHEGIIWADILLRHIVLWIGFLGAAIATSEDRHISIDAFARFLPDRVCHAASAITHLFAAAVCGILAHASLTFIHNDLASGSEFLPGIPAWYSEIIIPVGFVLLALHFVIRACVKVAAAAGRGTA